jgi:aryl-alcohol dehydrogenase-like predicted oxidoreductase
MIGPMLETLPFGTTGHDSTRIIFGAAALGAMSPARTETTMQLLLDHGVNHIDTAADYGESEVRLAPFLAEHRGDVFLATKTGERTGPEARAGLERSLERMGVDHVDLVQLHNLVEEDEWRTAFSPGGAVEALFRAADEGLCRHVGVTGHGLRIARMHLRSLAEAPFASVLAPWNHSLATAFPDYADDMAMLRELCTNQGVAVQTIKSLARGRWTDPDGPRFSWYEPIGGAEARRRAIEFVLAEPDLFLNTSSDARLLAETLEVAAGPRRAPDAGALAADREAEGITPLFDGAELERI